jgi:large subunit ribosomal protein L31e
MVEERILILNLRKDLSKTRRGRKAGSLARILRRKVQKIFKDQRIVIDRAVNEEVWRRGMKKPLTRLKLKIVKDEKTVRVELGK